MIVQRFNQKYVGQCVAQRRAYRPTSLRNDFNGQQRHPDAAQRTNTLEKRIYNYIDIVISYIFLIVGWISTTKFDLEIFMKIRFIYRYIYKSLVY